MAKGDHAKRDHSAGKADTATTSKPADPGDDKVAKAERRRAKKVVKVEVQLADAREIQAAVEALVTSLERKLAELQAPAVPTPAAPAAASAPSTRRATRPRATRAAAPKPRGARARAPRKATPPA